MSKHDCEYCECRDDEEDNIELDYLIEKLKRIIADISSPEKYQNLKNRVDELSVNMENSIGQKMSKLESMLKMVCDYWETRMECLENDIMNLNNTENNTR